MCTFREYTAQLCPRCGTDQAEGDMSPREQQKQAAQPSTATAESQRSARGQPEQWDAEDWAQDECTLCFATADCQFYTSPYLKTHVMKRRRLKQQKIQEM